MSTRRLVVYAATILFLAASYFLRLSFEEPPQVIPKNQQLTFVATVTNQPRLSQRYQIIKVADSLLFAPYWPRHKVGDRLLVEGFVDENGRIFNARIEKVGERAGVLPILAKLRQTIAANIDGLLPTSEAALVKGMVLGVDEIGRDLRESLIATGTIHVVVVSGQNLSVVAGLFLGLVAFIGRRLSLVLATGAVFFYALLTGFGPPVVRASLMVLASTIAIYYGRQVMPTWSLIIAALIILFFAPQALFEASFQLTFAATLGIMTLGQWLSKIFNSQLSILNLIKNNAAVATSAYLFTTPIIWWHFERVSAVAPAANTLVAGLVAPIMILGFLVTGASLVFMPLAQVLAYLAYMPAFVFIKIVEIFAQG